MERPTSVTVLAIINMAFAVLGFCGLIMSGAVFVLPSDPMMPNPVVELLSTSAIYKAWYSLAIGLGFFATLALGALGVGLLRVARWGRMLAIGYCI
jgi:hypothetical protein